VTIEKNICPYCKEEIRPAAVKCKHCGSTLEEKSNKGNIGFAIASLILGIISLFALMDDTSGWDQDTINGLFLFSGLGLIFGIITVSQKYDGKGMGIAGIIMSVIGLLGWVGLISH
jgi:hypothetical protein